MGRVVKIKRKKTQKPKGGNNQEPKDRAPKTKTGLTDVAQVIEKIEKRE